MPSPEKLRTVASLLIAAIGESTGVEPLTPIPANWYYDDDAPLTCTQADNIPLAFLANAKRHPFRPVWADQLSGVFTNRKMVLAVLALLPQVEKLKGDRVGVLMPASCISTLLYLAVQFAGKTPVMINWTVGNRNMRSCLESVPLESILTSQALVERLKGTGVDFTGIEEKFVMLESLKESIGLLPKLVAFLRSRFWWRKLWKAKIRDEAVVLFTSGSETNPKAVPLTQQNLMVDVTNAAADMNIPHAVEYVELFRNAFVKLLRGEYHKILVALIFLENAAAFLRPLGQDRRYLRRALAESVLLVLPYLLEVIYNYMCDRKFIFGN